MAAAAIAMLGFGCYIMSRIDRFLTDNQGQNKKTDYTPPSYVQMDGDLPEEEILEEVRRFYRSHKNTKIVLYEEEEKE